MKKCPSDINDHFLSVFTEIELLLKEKVRPGIDTHEKVVNLITKYAEKNPYWQTNAQKLKRHAGIRNILAHEKSLEDGAPITVRKTSLRSLLEIHDSLKRQIPISDEYRIPVTCVSKHDSLGKVVQLAYDNGFSQFPVVDEGRFRGLITESEIVRWLGHKAHAKIPNIDLTSVHVVTVLEEKDPFKKGMLTFSFARLDASVPEVMSWFAREPSLEAVLLTSTGKNSAPIEGIVTQWDAARYFN